MTEPIYYYTLPDEASSWTLLGSGNGVCALLYREEQLVEARGWLDAVAPHGYALRADRAPFEAFGVVERLRRYFAGERVGFEGIPLDIRGTAFQREVWTALADIPYGETRTYGEVASAIGRPRATRAVGAANGRNPLPVLLPCHRVVGADGTMTGYRGGLAMKKRLLAIEGIGGVAERGHARFRF
ncbi:methylated-DNA--[protein]-cysteine S-methyltransferase [Paenibacillus sp.]|uniref:methylated-DNA--[protein]-cysteine S-methyltransferase n=1 Tax=Paenibacillus sp. TaxID=58172 RepID=UPI002D761DDA|nr:methylated-DNA--[protein]-cysteine S-methyltransferase [Paenibacillus sp.]HZG57919.1 methylated-DNA--[protein]-cysteine S-methyltransferase [Paenibacillus sp.]